jgi:hypothetical protein
VLQRLAVEKLHHQENLRLIFVNIVKDADVGIIERRRGSGLAAVDAAAI